MVDAKDAIAHTAAATTDHSNVRSILFARRWN
jgi:hypothetical protein